MDQPRIRLAAIEDSDGITVLLHPPEPGGANDLAAMAAAEVAVRNCIDEPGSDIFVAEAAGKVVGYAAVHWIPFPMLHGREGYISDLLIAPEWRGYGFGGRLVLAVEIRARELGCVRLMLNNRIAGESFGRGFFRKAGFLQRTDFANFVKSL